LQKILNEYLTSEVNNETEALYFFYAGAGFMRSIMWLRRKGRG
jgi:hypothetical protein